MNLSVMYGILNYLLARDKKISAQELAEEFEINQRTVYRYVDHLAMQQIPINTQIGRNGGIFIDPKFKIDRVCLNEDEMSYLKNILENDTSTKATNLKTKLNLL